MKRKVMFSLIALMAVVLTGFSVSSNVVPQTPPGMLFIVQINDNSLVQDCGETVKLTFNGKTMSQPYTGASTYYFHLNKATFTGTICASLVTDGTCADDVNILGPCITDTWNQGDISTFTIRAYKDEM